MRALFLCPETPYPLAGGGALRSASLLHYLARRYDVHLIIFRQPGAPQPELPEGLIHRLDVIDLPPNGRSVAARALRNASRLLRRVPPLVDRFAGFPLPLHGPYDLGIVEHSWAAPYWEQIAPACRRTVLDLHNIESTLHTRCAETESGALAMAHRVFRDASLELERRWFRRYSTVLCTSEDDARVARSIAPGLSVTVYPNALPPTTLPAHLDREEIVFSGNMEYHPNLAAVRFFRAEIWPNLRDRWPALVWRLVGKNPEAIRRYTEGDSRIHVAGAVADAVSEIAQSRVAVVPLLSGSGTRLKILEAWAAGLPVVSTTIGAEGLPVQDGKNLLLADGAEAFAKSVTRLLECSKLRSELGQAGRLLLEKEFTWETAWGLLDL